MYIRISVRGLISQGSSSKKKFFKNFAQLKRISFKILFEILLNIETFILNTDKMHVKFPVTRHKESWDVPVALACCRTLYTN